MEFDAVRDNLTALIMETEHHMGPAVDSVDRMRGELIGRGWSEGGAERMATAWFSWLVSGVKR